MSPQEFTAAVLKRVYEHFEVPDPRDREIAAKTTMELYVKGYTVNDTVSYLFCLEHVNPELEEATALRRMSEIQAKYPRATEYEQ